jgi:predicted XRE-type DNA-binding protein
VDIGKIKSLITKVYEEKSSFNMDLPKSDEGLSEADVIQIRELYKTGKYTQTYLAKVFGVATSTVSRAVRGKIHKESGGSTLTKRKMPSVKKKSLRKKRGR